MGGGCCTYVSAGLAVVPPLGDGVERLLALHAQGHLLLPDGRRRPFPQLHTALREHTGKSPQKKLPQVGGGALRS